MASTVTMASKQCGLFVVALWAAAAISMGLQGCDLQDGCDEEAMATCVSDSVAKMTGTDFDSYCNNMVDYMNCYDGCCKEPGMTSSTKSLYDLYSAAPYNCEDINDPCS